MMCRGFCLGLRNFGKICSIWSCWDVVDVMETWRLIDVRYNKETLRLCDSFVR